jgi:hypothetical protein
MDNTRVDEYQLPRTPQGMYALLEHGIDQYMTFFDNAKEVDFDRDTEMLSVVLDKNDAMLITGYMRLKIFQKINDEFVSTYDVLQDDIGIRNYKSQSDARQNLIAEQKREIDEMLLKMSEDFDVIDDM